jgi:hypothetical protein
MSQKFNITFDFVEVKKQIKGKEVKIAVTLVDNAGYLCGIYNNYREAKEAMPKIRRNILNSLRQKEKAGQLIPVQFLNT